MSGDDPKNGAAEDVAILIPDVDLQVRDPDTGEPVAVTVREYRFLESLGAKAEAQPLFAAMATLADTAGEAPASRSSPRSSRSTPISGSRSSPGRPARTPPGSPGCRPSTASASAWRCGRRTGVFYPGRRDRDGQTPPGNPVLLSRVLDELVRAGHGNGHRDVMERLTWRQIELFWRCAEERMAAAFGAKPKEG